MGSPNWVGIKVYLTYTFRFNWGGSPSLSQGQLIDHIFGNVYFSCQHEKIINAIVIWQLRSSSVYLRAPPLSMRLRSPVRKSLHLVQLLLYNCLNSFSLVISSFCFSTRDQLGSGKWFEFYVRSFIRKHKIRQYSLFSYFF